MEHQAKIEKLIEQGFQCIGMIDEAKSKCILLKRKIIKKDVSFVKNQLLKIKNDIDTYSKRLMIINKELQDNEPFFKLE